MGRNQQRVGRVLKNDSDGRLQVMRSRNGSEIEEVLAPYSRRDSCKMDKPLMNRCCYASPSQRSFGQLTTPGQVTPDRYQTLIAEQYGFMPVTPDTMNQLRELRKVLCGSSHKVENSSQYAEPAQAYVEALDGVQWQHVDNADDIDKYMRGEVMKGRDEETLTQYHSLPKNIHISEVPRVKLIAVKFTKFKKNNIELRKLEEKVVCVEYDVYDQPMINMAKPVQKMRAFFSIKPVKNDDTENVLKEIPSTIKNKFKIASEDLQKLSKKEVEIIDGKLLENQPYLEDLRKILRRKQGFTKKSTNTLDLHTLYHMANRNYMDMNEDTTNLSQRELLEVQKVILEKCKSSVLGINRRTVKSDVIPKASQLNTSAISQSILAELLREDAKNDPKYNR